MARPARFSDDDLLDAAAAAVGDVGREFTIADVSRRSGAPTGSIYHRFSSRDEISARLWLRSIERFHEGLLEALRLDDPAAAVDAAIVHIPRFCRERALDAIGMTLHRQPRLAASLAGAQDDLHSRVVHANDAIDDETVALAGRLYGEVTERRVAVLRVATRLCPYGLVRPYVGGELPEWAEDACLAAGRAIAELGR